MNRSRCFRSLCQLLRVVGAYVACRVRVFMGLQAHTLNPWAKHCSVAYVFVELVGRYGCTRLGFLVEA